MIREGIRKNERGFAMLNAALVLTLASAGTAGALVYNAGAIRVHVQEMREGGENINLVIPAAIIPVALALMPASVLDDIPMEARQAFPILRAIGRALADAPDFVLVEVRERDEHVLVEKRGGSFHISVESGRENVQVSFPISVILSIANKLESLPASDSNFDAESGDAEDWEEDLAEIL